MNPRLPDQAPGSESQLLSGLTWLRSTRGSSVVISTSVVKFSATLTFWDLLEHFWSEEKPLEAFEFCPGDVSTVLIAKDSTFSSSSQDVKLQHEVAVCQLFDCKYVSFNLKSSKDNQCSTEIPHRSAFDVLRIVLERKCCL